jgi:hypothetical protein
MCPRERLVLINISTGLSFAKKGLDHLLRLFVTSVTCSLFCYFVRKPLKIRLLSIHMDFLLHTTVQHLMLLVGIDTPIYRKYYDIPPILVGHHGPRGYEIGQEIRGHRYNPQHNDPHPKQYSSKRSSSNR